jgi:hypothetical protein
MTIKANAVNAKNARGKAKEWSHLWLLYDQAQLPASCFRIMYRLLPSARYITRGLESSVRYLTINSVQKMSTHTTINVPNFGDVKIPTGIFM